MTWWKPDKHSKWIAVCERADRSPIGDPHDRWWEEAPWLRWFRWALDAGLCDALAFPVRSVSLGKAEALQQTLRDFAATPDGRRRLRERIPIEHVQAHTCYRQGRKARYLGSRNNLFDLHRASIITSLRLVQRTLKKQAEYLWQNVA